MIAAAALALAWQAPPHCAAPAFPARDWPSAAPSRDADLARLDAAADRMFARADVHARALLIVQHGRLVYERYGDGRDRTSPLLSHSIAKFVLGTFIGALVQAGRLDLDRPLPGFWQAGDPRLAITFRTAMQMRSGLRWQEDYADIASDLPETMLGRGRLDQARHIAGLPLAVPPGSRFSYSSGDANLISGGVGNLLGGGAAYRRALDALLFSPLGLNHVEPGFDASGTYVASSWFWATARDYARIGALHLAGGMWNGRRILPANWRAVITATSDPASDSRNGYGALTALFSDGAYGHTGHRGQLLMIDPARGLVIVRFADTRAQHDADAALQTATTQIREAFPRGC